MKKQPTQAQLKARAKFAEQAKNRVGFEMTVKVNDKVFNCKTKNLEEALEQLGKDVGTVKTRLVLKVKKGNRTRDQILTVPRARRLFITPLFRKLFVQNLEKAFK